MKDWMPTGHEDAPIPDTYQEAVRLFYSGTGIGVPNWSLTYNPGFGKQMIHIFMNTMRNAVNVPVGTVVKTKIILANYANGKDERTLRAVNIIDLLRDLHPYVPALETFSTQGERSDAMKRFNECDVDAADALTAMLWAMNAVTDGYKNTVLLVAKFLHHENIHQYNNPTFTPIAVACSKHA